MAFMLKIRWNIAPGKRAAFRAAQQTLCTVMLDHPGVITYHADYPAEASATGPRSTPPTPPSAPTSTTPPARPRSAPSSPPATASSCRCFGDPDPASREILKGFGTTYHPTAENAFVLNPRADRTSQV